MRIVTLLAVVALLVASAYATPFDTSVERVQKVTTHDPRPYPPAGDAGGETFADAVDMGALPFNDSGNLWLYADDIDFGFGTSPDVVYSYTPEADGCITVDLCGSNYDSMLFIVDEDLNIVLWNDDGSACDLYQSQISWMYVYAGVKYFYVVDGFDGSAGPYVLDVFARDCPPPPECPPEALLEGEGCADPYIDTYNSGCNGAGYVELTCSDEQIVICGTIFTYDNGAGLTYRDTDWYLLTDLVGGETLTATGYFESTGSVYFIKIDPDCAGSVTIPYGIHMGSRELGTQEGTLDAGFTWVLFLSRQPWGGDSNLYPCTDPESWPYVATLDGYGCPPVPTDSDTWGGVKNLFK